VATSFCLYVQCRRRGAATHRPVGGKVGGMFVGQRSTHGWRGHERGGASPPRQHARSRTGALATPPVARQRFFPFSDTYPHPIVRHSFAHQRGMAAMLSRRGCDVCAPCKHRALSMRCRSRTACRRIVPGVCSPQSHGASPRTSRHFGYVARLRLMTGARHFFALGAARAAQ